MPPIVVSASEDSEGRIVPLSLDVAEAARGEHQIYRTIAHDLIRDVGVIGNARVPCLRYRVHWPTALQGFMTLIGDTSIPTAFVPGHVG